MGYGVKYMAWAALVAIAVVTARGLPVAQPAWIAHPEEPFSIMATEVTVDHFRACIEAGACDPSSIGSGCNYERPERSDHPVNCVSHDGAAGYCSFVDARLCAEHEWLSACRGEDDRAFPYGADFDLAACNSQSTSENPQARPRETMAVAALPSCEGGLPGLFDMAGNVAEWVADCKGDYCKFRGAGYLSNAPVAYFTGCSGVCSGNQKSLQSGIVGFRCCRDRSPGNP